MTKNKAKKVNTKAKITKAPKKSQHRKTKNKSAVSNLWALKWAAIAIVALAVIGITQIEWKDNKSYSVDTNENVASEVAEFQPGSIAIYSPETASVGEEFTVDLMSNSSELVNAAQVELNYPYDTVQYLGVDESASTFDVKAPIAVEGGKVIVPVGSTQPLQNEQTVAKLKFKVINTGSINLSLGEETKLLRAADATDVIGNININKIVTVAN